MPIDKDLEDLLKSAFRIDAKKAEEVASALTFGQFDTNFTRLESIIGFDSAVEIIRKGEFLGYQNDRMEEYFGLVNQVYQQLDPKSPIPPKFFYSIETLKEFLGVAVDKKIVIDPSKLEQLDIGKYKILHKDNKQSRGYLDSLIERGYIQVKGYEHWNKGSKTSGARGRHILEKITYELSLIFHNLGLNRPESTLNYGQHTLIVYGATRELLRGIRDKVYSLQK